MRDANSLRYLIGKRVHDFRVSNNYTQAQFAETIDISVNFLSEIENGKKGMSQETLYKLCESHNISADYILFGTENSEVPTASQKTQRIIDIAGTLELEEIDIVIDFLTSLRKIRGL